MITFETKEKHLKELTKLEKKTKITKEEINYIRNLHAKVLKVKPKQTSCNSCIKGWIKNIKLILSR